MGRAFSGKLVWTFAAVCMALCGAAGWWLGRSKTSNDSAVTQKRLEALEARVAAGAGSADLMPSGRALDRVVRGNAAGPVPADLDPVAARKKVGAAIASFDGRFAADGREPAWASRAETVAAEAMLAPGLREFGMPTSDETRCGTTMCRMVFTFENAGTAADWSDYYPLGIASVLPGVRSYPVTLPDGRVELHMYGFRGEATSRMDARLPEP